MRREEIMRELEARGFQVEKKDTVKNGVIFQGILICDDQVAKPIIYTEKIIQDAETNARELNEVVDEFIQLYEVCKGGMEIEVPNLMNRDWVMEHLSIAIQKSSSENLVKKDLEHLEGMEAYLLIKNNENEKSGYSIKLGLHHLEHLRLSEEEAWKVAYQHICEDTYIIGMSQVMNELLGVSVEDEDHEMLYVISNSDNIKGAGAILNQEALKEFTQKKGVSRLFVLPSSIHEMIIVPDYGEYDLSDLSGMVSEVNATQVDPEEQLPNRAYLLEF